MENCLDLLGGKSSLRYGGGLLVESFGTFCFLHDMVCSGREREKRGVRKRDLGRKK